MRRTPNLALLLAALLSAGTLGAQTAHWSPAGGSLPVGEVTSLELVFDDCSPEDTPAPPKVDGLVLNYQGQSSTMSLINGTFTRNVALTFAALLQRQQPADIPAFAVKTNRGTIQVPAAHFAPAGATVGSGGVSLSEAASATLAPSKNEVWEGEVFDLRYSVEAATGYGPTWGNGSFEWDPSPLVIEDWSQPEPFNTNDGGPKTGLNYRTRALAPSAGHIALNPTSQLVSLSVGVAGFGFFQQRQYQQFSVPDSPVAIDVRPLPPGPAGFAGAVGSFSISSKVVPRRVNVGEPVTWTVELAGSGNWPKIRYLPSREAPADFQVIQPKPKQMRPPGKLFEGSLSEDVVLIPSKAGSYELPALNFVYFDPVGGIYRTVTAPGAEITVDAPGPAASPAPGQVGPAPGAPTISTEAPATTARAPEAPSAALGDPMAPAGSAPEPLRLRTVAVFCGTPFVLVLLFWASLAYLRARQTDPLRRRRDARVRLGSILSSLGASPAEPPAALLLEWQQESAALWGVDSAAPVASSLPDPEWALLWQEADRRLYRADTALPQGWVDRAKAALGRKPERAFNPARLLLPRNLFPALVLCLAGAAAARLGAADPAGAYAGGKFATAANGWSQRLALDPLDWSARHNLSLALAQQDRWAEAAAQASGAFVQQPASPEVRRLLAVTTDKAGFIPEPLDFLSQAGPVQSLARLESPGGWQRTAACASAAGALGLGLLLAAAYGRARRRWAGTLGRALLVLALLAGAASLVAYRAFGIAADARCVVIWRTGTLRSVPTEADVSQKTTPLPAGSIAVADREFLDWIRLSFPNGETGWVPSSEAVFLWRSPRP
jgi:hypothetical protein